MSMKKEIQMTANNVLRAAVVVIVASASVVGLSACSSAPISPTQLASLEAILATCPASINAVVDVRVDESGSRYSTRLDGQDRQAVLDGLTRAAVCGHGVGRFRLDLFSASIASSANVVDVKLELPGSTDIARLRQVPALIGKITKSIDRNYSTAAESLTDGGTDIPAQLFAAQQFTEQARSDTPAGQAPYDLNLVILTDGESNAGDSFVSPTSSIAEAAALATATDVPNLKGSSILIAGVGDTASGPRPSSAYVAALTQYLDVLCHRTGASKVTVVTDYTAIGR
jgi:hypothetical protein